MRWPSVPQASAGLRRVAAIASATAIVLKGRAVTPLERLRTAVECLDCGGNIFRPLDIGWDQLQSEFVSHRIDIAELLQGGAGSSRLRSGRQSIGRPRLRQHCYHQHCCNAHRCRRRIGIVDVPSL